MLGIFTIGIGVLVYILLGIARQEDGPPVDDGKLNEWVRYEVTPRRQRQPVHVTRDTPSQRLTLNPAPPSDTGDGYGEGWNWRMMFELWKRW